MDRREENGGREGISKDRHFSLFQLGKNSALALAGGVLASAWPRALAVWQLVGQVSVVCEASI